MRVNVAGAPRAVPHSLFRRGYPSLRLAALMVLSRQIERSIGSGNYCALPKNWERFRRGLSRGADPACALGAAVLGITEATRIFGLSVRDSVTGRESQQSRGGAVGRVISGEETIQGMLTIAWPPTGATSNAR